MRNLDVLLLLYGVFLVPMIDACKKERVERCWPEGYDGREESIREDQSGYCQAVVEWMECLKKLERSCRGNLDFYMHRAGAQKIYNEANCDSVVKSLTRHASRVRRPPKPTTAEPPIVLPEYHGCSTISLSNDMSYCAVFGDPHVITADGVFSTCRISGAYPLIENRHLAVQVTSKPIRKASSSEIVTSISRITVIVKKSECFEERKTYEVGLGLLTAFFTDMTSEGDLIKLVERVPNQLVEIKIVHLKTIIFVRQIGNYLSVAVRIPSSLLNSEAALTAYQLCSAGCPAREVISRLDSIKDLPVGSVRNAEMYCRNSNLTGAFYEACLFDFALTGDLDTIQITKEAHNDYQQLAPATSILTTGASGNRMYADAFAVRSSAGRIFDIRWILVMRNIATMVFISFFRSMQF